MPGFFRSRHGVDYEEGFVQGAGRLVVAPSGTDWPADISDILDLASGATQYDLQDPWIEVGFTKTGINITRNNAEEDFTVDQMRASIRRRPSNWEMSVGTQLAEGSLETFALAWELDDPVDVALTAPQLSERHLGLSAPTSYKELLVAVLFQFPDLIIRAWVFRRGLHAAQESGFTLQSTGEQVSLPVRWNCMVDDSAPPESQFGEIFEQVPAVGP
jgi:hypothetical protein